MPLLARWAALLATIAFLSACKSTDTVLTVSYEGQGTITQGSKINCGNTCEATYPVKIVEGVASGSYTVDVVATAAAGFEFFGWQQCGSDATCTTLIEPDCAEYNIGPNIITCKRYQTHYLSHHAIFVPQGSVIAHDWYGTSSCLVNSASELKCWNTGFAAADLPTVNNPAAIDIAYKAGCVRDASGLQCWGHAALNMPVLVNPGSFVVDDIFSCAIDQGAVQCWDHLGRFDEVVRSIPALSNPSRLWTQNRFPGNVCAQDDNGVHCWGRNLVGQATPPALNNPTRIAAYDDTTCALTADGVRCWGAQYDVAALNGQLNSAVDISAPSPLGMCAVDGNGAHCIASDHAVLQLPAELQHARTVHVSKDRMCTTTADGILCINPYTNPATSYVPPVTSTGDRVAMAGPAGCALSRAARRVSCWGSHTGSWISGNLDIAVPLTNPDALALTPQNDMWCAGGASGLFCRRQANRPSYLVSSLPVPTGLQQVVSIDMTDTVACAAHSQGVTCWGDASWGQLEVPVLRNPVQVAVGRFHACALDDTGVVCWGATPAPPQ